MAWQSHHGEGVGSHQIFFFQSFFLVVEMTSNTFSRAAIGVQCDFVCIYMDVLYMFPLPYLVTSLSRQFLCKASSMRSFL